MNTLDTLEPGREATISAINGQGTSLRRRLLDMGLTPSTRVKVIKVAPLGDPMELDVRGYMLTIRKEDARLIEVQQ
ncbi:MAG: ferrous iron transport protein A [Succinivibrionaceae bacterium]|nr:ferrous iron transport protein A [Succinivibrionaceae bacterium]